MDITNYDVFISHAHEDKEAFVAPLAGLLSNVGVTVWYDEFSLKVGDSLSGSIDRGLASSRYGVIVVSRHFIAKPWPIYELRGLINKEIGQDKVILPIWHDITREEVLRFSPSLTDKLALNTSTLSLEQIAFQLLKTIRPELYHYIVRYKRFQELVNKGTPTYFKIEDLQPGPIRHEKLPDGLMVRLAIIYQILGSIAPKPFKEFVEAFQRDLYPERELQNWERIAYAYLSFTKNRSTLEASYTREILSALLRISVGQVPTEALAYFSEEEIQELIKLYSIPESGHFPN